ncbi:hypothetical protein V6N11_021968 [Hibiscus sabdariffa]|uniref:Uncharacterized protein n=1 Tax=Hibiscus sabdariffa TaxID=183260 RepID=A0ABR2THT2_9ROSI
MITQRHRSTRMIEPLDPRSFNKCTPQTGDTSNDMNNAGVGEIDDTTIEKELIGSKSTSPTISRPKPMRNNMVNEPGQKR